MFFLNCLFCLGLDTLYYFCNQWTNKKTQLQRSLEKASKPKHINIVSFASFVERCPKDLVESILSTFINLGKSLNIEEDFINDQLTIEDQNEKFQQSLSSKSGLLISKKSLENCLCRNYFDNLLFDDELIDSSDMPKNFDFYCAKFLTTIFENNPIDNVNMILFLENLKSLVPEYYFQIIEKRWHSNIKYYMSQYEESYKLLLDAYKMAISNENKIDDWFIDDILIDLRNRENKMLELKNQYTSENFGQNELNKRSGKLYYPVLDRFEKNLLTWIDEDRQKNDMRAYSSSRSYGDLTYITNNIADYYYQSMMFGSLTHLFRVSTLIQKFTCHISKSSEYWPMILMLYKTTILNLDHKGAKQISRNFSEILQKMDFEDARSIYNFSMNSKPIEDQFISNLIAMSEVGYYLSDSDFTNFWSKLEKKIKVWNEQNDGIVLMESHIFRCIERISNRLDDNYILDFALKILLSNKKRYYSNALKLISNNNVDYRAVNVDFSNKTIEVLISYIENNNDYNEIEKIKNIFILLENMDIQHVELLENFIQVEWADFYSTEYQFEKKGTVDSEMNLLNRFIDDINKRNDIQGKNGTFSLYGSDPYLYIMGILRASENNIDESILNKLIVCVAGTILSKNQTINEKVSAYKVTIYLLKCYPELMECNDVLLKKIVKMKDYDQANETMISHIDNIVSSLCHFLFLETLGMHKYKEIVEILSFFGNPGRQIEACKVLKVFLTNHENLKISSNIESLILQSVLLWSNSTDIDVRWYNVQLQLKFYELKKFRKVIGQNLQMIAMNDNAIVKSQVLHKLEKIRVYDSKLASVISETAENDNNYVIRKIIVDQQNEKK